jgi:hypothetical protein
MRRTDTKQTGGHKPHKVKNGQFFVSCVDSETSEFYSLFRRRGLTHGLGELSLWEQPCDARAVWRVACAVKKVRFLYCRAQQVRTLRLASAFIAYTAVQNLVLSERTQRDEGVETNLRTIIRTPSLPSEAKRRRNVFRVTSADALCRMPTRAASQARFAIGTARSHAAFCVSRDTLRANLTFLF